MSKSGVLCIDFGTSSIRAVRRMPDGQVVPLDIGRVTQSQLDDASIRSEIHIDAGGKTVSFGERALVARKPGSSPLLYASSPKLWMKRLGDLTKPLDGLAISRANLLAGLLANAISACMKAGDMSDAVFAKLDVRIAHPVWPGGPDEVASADRMLGGICAQARRMAMEHREWDGRISVDQIHKLTRVEDPPSRETEDVIEPTAAAVELLTSAENERRVCAVVDIGAGTTDIGLFQGVAPDSVSSVRGKLYSIGKPRSVFKAGDAIDTIVFELLLERAGFVSPADQEEVRVRIRRVKESLFRDGFVQVFGVNLTLDDLERESSAKKIAKEIRQALDETIAACENELASFVKASLHSASCLEIVVAGGGAGIPFIRKALSKNVKIADVSLPVKLIDDSMYEDFPGASRGRMAVALGGARMEFDRLVRQAPPSEGIYRRGAI